MKQDPRIILIAGGNSGIGRGIAERFSDDGDQVIIWGRDLERLNAVAKAANGRITAEVVDVTRSNKIKTAVERVVEKHGHIDVLVNAAGYPKPLTTSTPYEQATKIWDELIAVNLTSSFLLAQATAKYLSRPGGRVIFIGSAAAFTGSGRPGGIGYAAAKAGLSGLVFALTKDLAPSGITVNAVVPGFVADTGITSQWPAQDVQSFIKQTPAGRAGTPADIAPAVSFLASPEAGFITGQFLHVNGGMLLGRS